MRIMKKPKSEDKVYVDYCILGTGNIAIKHLDNVKKMSKSSQIVVIKRSSVKTNKVKTDSKTYLKNNLTYVDPKSKSSTAIICSPATYHIKDAIMCANKGFNIFIEKPLTTELRDFKKLAKIILDKKLKIFVGYNMKFFEKHKYLKKIITDKRYGSVLDVRINVETNFKRWRKNKNYTLSVSSKKELGGGVINELSHETDYMYDLFGKPSSVVVNNMYSSKEHNVDTHIYALFSYKQLKNRILMNLNMLSGNNSRTCTIFFEKAIVIANHLTNNIDIFHNNKKYSKNFSDNLDMTYTKELVSFKKDIVQKKKTNSYLNEIINVQKVLCSMQKSINNNSICKIDYQK